MPLSQLRTIDALRQLAGPLERVRTTYLLRGGGPTTPGHALAPEHVLIHWALTVLAVPAVTGTDTVYTRAAPRVGRTLSIGGTDFAVVSVTRGSGMFAVELDDTIASSYATGTRCAYDVPCWWDSFEWDIAAGAITYDGTALDMYPDSDFLSEITLGQRT